jgi:superfamily II DNA or RNA helicase
MFLLFSVNHIRIADNTTTMPSIGDTVLLDDKHAEVIDDYTIGDLPYMRVYIEDEGVKSVCLEDVEVEEIDDPIDRAAQKAEDLHPAHETASAKWFDLRSQALRLRIAHEQGQLLSISSSRVRLEPYQLDAVNRVMEKLRQRALIADDVGLGKTIEAGLILKELDARNRADRILFVVPAHLRKKWVREMDRYFDIELTVADRKWVEGERRRLGEETNIWNQDNQRLITSMAFARQDEFRSEFEEAFWDVVVVDEAHKAAKRGESPAKQAKAVETISQNSDSLLLLSATPHDGKGDAFRSLIKYIDPFLAAQDQSLEKEDVDRVMIRRGKDSIYDDDGERIFPDREVKTVSVDMTSEEKCLYEEVTDYVKNVYNRSERLNEPAVGFAMALMQKRLVSSVGAIRETLRRRLNDLLEEKTDVDSLSEDSLAYLEGSDLDEDAKQRAEEEIEGLTVAGTDEELKKEIDRLRNIVSLAEDLPVDSKAQKVRRFISQLLEEQPDEKVLLFTEYRDTLEYILSFVEDEPWADEILVIHGDVDKEERVRIEEKFNRGKPRLLFATDAASEGIDLQESCHIMVNYELPWNPNRLEQRIGRLHRYGQENEVKVWNFTFEDTREGEIFETLQEKVENIRSSIGNTADVLGMLDNINIDSLILDSIREEKPPGATKEELEDLIDEKQQTLEEWYERSLVDTSTFDADSREKIKEVMDESEDVYGTQSEIRDFFTDTVETLGGQIEKKHGSVYRAELPEDIGRMEGEIESLTFDRELATEDEDLTFVSPDSEVVQKLINEIIRTDRGELGVKILPFVEKPGITYSYTVAFEDGTGEVVQEELIPVFVDLEHADPNKRLGEKVVDGDSIRASPGTSTVQDLINANNRLRDSADRYVSEYVSEQKQELAESRRKETEEEIEKLNEYADAERERIEEFISDYERKADIRKQQKRLERIEERIDDRREKLRTKARVVSIAPEVENYCLTIPVE